MNMHNKVRHFVDPPHHQMGSTVCADGPSPSPSAVSRNRHGRLTKASGPKLTTTTAATMHFRPEQCVVASVVQCVSLP